ncbi:MAG: radical SAM protein [Lachnospiraceae bacterium]|nr:radical SAM protein [Lachnospiraceae bacterium]
MAIITERTKHKQMSALADYRDNILRHTPVLHHLFIELPVRPSSLGLDEYKAFLMQVKEDFDISHLNLCFAGAEPLRYPSFFELADYAHNLGFMWGMTTNGTLIDSHVARRLADLGMSTVSVRIDGLEKTHNFFRQYSNAYERTMSGIRELVLLDVFKHVQVTTVVDRRNIGDIKRMRKIIADTGVRSWRIMNIESTCYAPVDKKLMLTGDEIKRLMHFIRENRHEPPMEITYGCSHFLGPKLEREVRQWYFLCNAGIYTASIDTEGNILACPDIPRRPELIQGNIKTDRFKNVWEEEYKIFRTDYRKQGKCADCKYYRHCAGDSFHTWDFDKNEPGMCMKGILFK